MFRRDPLANPGPQITRVYQYVSYRVGDGPQAEDITSDVFERALRYRGGYDSSRGEPIAWLIGIAQRCIAGALRPQLSDAEPRDAATPGQMDDEIAQRLTLKRALATLGERDQELLALRYGADLTARQIGDILELRTNAVEVSIHRALERLRAALEDDGIVEAAQLLASL